MATIGISQRSRLVEPRMVRKNVDDVLADADDMIIHVRKREDITFHVSVRNL